jgi:hypothetical protein
MEKKTSARLFICLCLLDHDIRKCVSNPTIQTSLYFGEANKFFRKGEERSFYQPRGQPEEHVRRLYSFARGRKPFVTASGGRIAPFTA